MLLHPNMEAARRVLEEYKALPKDMPRDQMTEQQKNLRPIWSHVIMRLSVANREMPRFHRFVGSRLSH